MMRMDDHGDVVDPADELDAGRLRALIIRMLEEGRVSIPSHAGKRQDEKHVTTPQIESALRSGALATESFDLGAWRYRATRQGVTVIFTFATDEDGNTLVVVTTWRNNR